MKHTNLRGKHQNSRPLLRARKVLVGLAATVLLTVSCYGWDDDRVHEDFHYNYKLASGGTLSLDTFNGSVEIMGGGTDSVDISGTKYAKNKDYLDQIKIEITQGSGSLRIRATSPKHDNGNWFNFNNGNMGAKFVLRVPKNIVLDRINSSNGAIKVESVQGPVNLHTSNGAIHVTDVEKRVTAESSNGAVDADHLSGGAKLETSNGRVSARNVTGEFEASTSNGNINVELPQPPATELRLNSSNGAIDVMLGDKPKAGIRAETSNSAITVRMPASAGATVNAHTSNSTISTDFDVTMHGKISKTSLEGNINGGGPLLELSTSNGSIRLVKN